MKYFMVWRGDSRRLGRFAQNLRCVAETLFRFNQSDKKLHVKTRTQKPQSLVQGKGSPCHRLQQSHPRTINVCPDRDADSCLPVAPHPTNPSTTESHTSLPASVRQTISETRQALRFPRHETDLEQAGRQRTDNDVRTHDKTPHSSSRMDCKASGVRPRRCALRLISSMVSRSDFPDSVASRKRKFTSKSSLRRSLSETER